MQPGDRALICHLSSHIFSFYNVDGNGELGVTVTWLEGAINCARVESPTSGWDTVGTTYSSELEVTTSGPQIGGHDLSLVKRKA